MVGQAPEFDRNQAIRNALETPLDDTNLIDGLTPVTLDVVETRSTTVTFANGVPGSGEVIYYRTIRLPHGLIMGED